MSVYPNKIALGESYYCGDYQAWENDDFGNLYSPYVPPPRYLNNQGRGEAVSAYLNTLQLKIIRDDCRAMFRRNEYAKAAVNVRMNYVVGGRGFSYRAVSETAPKLARDVQQYIDAIIGETDLHTREQEALRFCDVDGEVFLRLFPQPDGRVAIRYVPPEYIIEPAGVQGYDTFRDSFGIRTALDDVESVEGYWVTYQPRNEVVWVPADEMVHIKFNTDLTTKRGLPTLYGVLDQLSRCEQIIQASAQNVISRSKVAAVYKMPGMTKPAAKELIAGMEEETTPAIGSQKAMSVNKLPYGTMLALPGNADFTFPPASIDAAGVNGTLDPVLRGIASHFGLSEWALTANTNNSNYASSLVAEAPMVKSLQTEQERLCAAFGGNRYGRRAALMWRCLRHAVRCGLFPQETLRLVKIECVGPSLIARDQASEASTNKIYLEAGVKSRETIQQELGLDPDTERVRIEREKKDGGDGEAPGGSDDGGDGPPPSPVPSPVREAKDAAGNEHASDGKFTSGSGGGASSSKKKAEPAKKKAPAKKPAAAAAPTKKAPPSTPATATKKPATAKKGAASSPEAKASKLHAAASKKATAAKAALDKKAKALTAKKAAVSKAEAGHSAASAAHKKAQGEHAKAKTAHAAAIEAHAASVEAHKAAVEASQAEGLTPAKKKAAEKKVVSAAAKVEKAKAAIATKAKAVASKAKTLATKAKGVATKKAAVEKAQQAYAKAEADHSKAKTTHEGHVKAALHAGNLAQGKPPEPGFTGKDALGREWQNGKLVAKQDNSASEPASKAQSPAKKPAASASKKAPAPAAAPKSKAPAASAKPASAPVSHPAAQEIGQSIQKEIAALKSDPSASIITLTSAALSLADKIKAAAPDAKTQDEILQSLGMGKGYGVPYIAVLDHLKQQAPEADKKPSEKAASAPQGPYKPTAPNAVNGLKTAPGGPTKTNGAPGVNLGALSPPYSATAHAAGAYNAPNAKLPDDTRPELTANEQKAVQIYSSSEYKPINSALRDGTPLSERHQQVVAELANSFAKAKPLDPPVTVYRGLSIANPADLKQFVQGCQEAQKNGGTLAWPGYTSTSTGGFIPTFAGNVRITMKATHGLDLKPYTHYPHESELLLNHNSSFRVSSIKEINGTWHVEMEQVPPNENPSESPAADSPTVASAAPQAKKSVFQKFSSFLGGLFGKSK